MFVDNCGPETYTCRYTGKPVSAQDVTMVGALIPGVQTQYAVSPEGMAQHRQSVVWFHEAEANCNTCKDLERVSHNKGKGGFLYGRCNSAVQDLESHPYSTQFVDGVMIFHPHDPMHMPCYSSRFQVTTK